MKVVPGKRSHSGQPVYIQYVFQIRIDACKHDAEAGEVAAGGGDQVGFLGDNTPACVIPPCLIEAAQWTPVSGGASYLKPFRTSHGLERAGVGAMLP